MLVVNALSNRCRGAKDSGAALVVVLVLLVLLLALVLAFFSQSILGRQISKSSASRSAATLLVEGATNTIIGDLRAEIADPGNSGKFVPTGSAEAVYRPIVAKNVVPQYSNISPSLSVDGDETDGLANLVKVSGPQAFYTGAPLRGSSDPSIPGNDGAIRGTISPARWNKPLLLPATSGTNFTPTVSSALLPKWVYVQRSGGNSPSFSADMKWSPNLADDHSVVVGRYAYAIYNEGGILDVNVAGAPAGGSATQTRPFSYRGSLGFADLTGVPGMTTAIINALVGWRNQNSLQAGGTFPGYDISSAFASTETADEKNRNKYSDYLMSNHTGFMSVAGSSATGGADRMFVSRQQLISFLMSDQLGGNKSAVVQALNYLGTFSRDLNQPSVFRPAGSPALTSASVFGNRENLTVSDTPSSSDVGKINPNFLDVRVTKGFTRSDGSPAVVGEPLVKKRFPLSRLSLLDVYSSTSTSPDADAIQKYFGLVSTGTPGHWRYQPMGEASGVAAIKRLDQVATAEREPNFIELLKAALMVGSLGRSGGNDKTSLAPQCLEDQSVDAQVIRIAANIIDQADYDDFPTLIDFANAPSNKFQTYAGSENLPYLYSIRLISFASPDGTRRNYLLQPQVWNPVDKDVPVSSHHPSQFRVVAVSFDLTNGGISMNFHYVGNVARGTLSAAKLTFAEPSGNDAAGRFHEPVVLDQASQPAGLALSASDPRDTVPAAGGSHIGFWVGSAPTASLNGGSNNLSANGIWFFVECFDGKNWVRYDTLSLDTVGISMVAESANGDASKYMCGFRVDPRSARLNLAYDREFDGSYQKITPQIYLSQKPGAGVNNIITNVNAPNIPAFPWMYQNACPGNRRTSELSTNIFSPGSSYNSYQDPDQVTRGAMGCYSGSDLRGLPMADSRNATSENARPISLNRPFRSVGELGYVFRGAPWKPLDFATSQSGDAALLDVFCVNEDTRSDALRAGALDLNTRQKAVLRAVLAGSAENEVDATLSPLVSAGTYVDTFTKALISRTQTEPLTNRSELVGGTKNYTTNPADYTGLIQDVQRKLASQSEGMIHRFLETGVRALADVGTTRVWNLMIDVVAQTGRIPPPASDGFRSFQPEGECRYWVHIAIDRYTGKVLDQQVELVKE